MNFKRIFNTSWIWLMPSAMLILALIAWYAHAPLGDFANNYFGSLFFTSGMDLKEVYDIVRFNLNVRDTGLSDVYLNYNVLPPSNLLFFTPLNLLPPLASKIAFNILSGTALLHSGYRLINHMFLPKYYCLILLAFIAPISANIFQGQAYMLLLALVIYGFVFIEKGQKFLGTSLWAITVLVKVFPMILMLFFVERRDWKGCLLFIAAVFVLWAFTFTVIPTGLWLDYGLDIFPRLIANEFNDPFSQTYQSMSVLLRKVLVHDLLLNPQAILDVPSLFYTLELVYKLTAAWLVWTISRRINQPVFSVSVWLFYALVISGYSTTYSLILLLPLALWLVSQAKSYWTLGAVILLAVNIPVYFFSDLPLLLQFPRLWLMLALLLAMTYHQKVVIPIGVFSFILVLGIARFLFYVEPTQGDLVDTGISRSMLYDYSVIGNGIMLHTFNTKGREHIQFQTLDSISTIDTVSIEIRDDQIWYGSKQLTRGKCNLKSPVLVNEKDIYFLSDYGRGVGFYALRKLTLSDEL